MKKSFVEKNQSYLYFLIKQMETMPQAINSGPRNFKNGTEKVLWISQKL